MSRTFVVLLNMALVPASVVLLSASPRASEPIVVVTSPFAEGTSALDVIARAGGRILWGGRAPFIAVAAPGDEALLARLRQAGALILLDGSAAVSCGPGTEQRV